MLYVPCEYVLYSMCYTCTSACTPTDAHRCMPHSPPSPGRSIVSLPFAATAFTTSTERATSNNTCVNSHHYCARFTKI
ncbi:hypothetical protein BD777DRAFT_122279 [Yarrowia lipolytica]|nr:hypothetical protein BD777DRAFT_122279 [Yarrowia lipolytica]